MAQETTQKFFQNYAKEVLTEEAVEDIEANVKAYFELILEWNENCEGVD